jgi:PKD repeat protein
MILKTTQKIFLQGKRLLLIIPAVLLILSSAFSQTTTCKTDFEFDINHNTKTVVFKARSNKTPAVFGFKLGDGNFKRGQHISHTYASAGSYVVTLTTIAFDSVSNQRCTTKVSKKVEIVDCDRLKVAFKYEVDGMTVKVKGEANSNSVSTGFKFGDGHGSRGDEAKHTYDKPGVYSVCFIAEDSIYGCRQEVCKRVVISAPCDLEAKFEYRQENNDFKFFAKASDRPARFLWNFGDGEKGHGDEIKHSYDKPGTYEVCLVVFAMNSTNDQICTTRVCKKVIVKADNDCGLRAKFDFRQHKNQFKFEAVASDSPARFVWNFGDGETGHGAQIKHEYNKPGTYTVCLTVYAKSNSTTNQICTTKVCKRVVIEKPKCILEGDFRIASDGLNIKVQGKSNVEKVHYFWSFGDGTDATGKNARHRYEKPGVYEVCLIIFNPRTKCKICICKKVVVEKLCNLKATILTRIASDKVYVKARTNASRYSTYKWDFGDGSTATGHRARHQYKRKGVYVITLVINDRKKGCKIEITKRVVIGRQQLTAQRQDIGSDVVDQSDNKEVDTKLDEIWDAKVSPSPARNSVKISSDDKDLAKVEVYSLDGSRVIESKENLANIDISLLQKGFYYAHVTAVDGTTTIVKFLKD